MMQEKCEIGWNPEEEAKKSKDPIVVSNVYRNCFSIKELEEIELTSNCPLASAHWEVKEGAACVLLSDSYHFQGENVYQCGLREIVPLDRLEALADLEGTRELEVTFTTKAGDKITGYWGFKCILHSKNTARVVPRTDLNERLKQIPIAKPGMSEEKLRQICVDFFCLQCEFPYKLDRDFGYIVELRKLPRKLKAQVVQGGLPYITKGSGNLYRAAEFYDPKDGTLHVDEEVCKNPKYIGNACSGSASMAWSRVVNSATFGYTAIMTKAHGYLPIGPYRHSQEVKEFVKPAVDPNGYNCKRVCVENGEQTMYESYAAMKPADGIVNDGHVRMNVADPVVIRFEDGTIDGEKSYSLMTEQSIYAIKRNHVRICPDGSHYGTHGYVKVKYTFQELLENGYIPFTFAELTGQREVEEGWVSLAGINASGAATVEELREAKLSSNYPISDVFVTIEDKEGKEAPGQVYRFLHFSIKEAVLGEILPWDTWKDYVGGSISISCQLFNGELLKAWEGKLNP